VIPRGLKLAMLYAHAREAKITLDYVREQLVDGAELGLAHRTVRIMTPLNELLEALAQAHRAQTRKRLAELGQSDAEAASATIASEPKTV
jgi:hypothetical protein